MSDEIFTFLIAGRMSMVKTEKRITFFFFLVCFDRNNFHNILTKRTSTERQIYFCLQDLTANS